MKRFLIAFVALSLAGCTTTTGTLQDRAAVTSTNALSLAELAFTSMEQGATAYISLPTTTPEQAKSVGDLVVRARAERDQARILVANGQDSSVALQNLSTIISNINTITGAGK